MRVSFNSPQNEEVKHQLRYFNSNHSTMWRFKITGDTSASNSDLPNVFEAEHSHDDTDRVIIIADKTDEESVQLYFTSLKIQTEFSKCIQLVPHDHKFMSRTAIRQLHAYQNYTNST